MGSEAIWEVPLRRLTTRSWRAQPSHCDNTSVFKLKVKSIKKPITSKLFRRRISQALSIYLVKASDG
jgi:hypothetical protein